MTPLGIFWHNSGDRALEDSERLVGWNKITNFLMLIKKWTKNNDQTVPVEVFEGSLTESLTWNQLCS